MSLKELKIPKDILGVEQKIDEVASLQNGVRFYKSLTDVSPTLTVDSTMVDVVSAMSDNSILIARYPNATVGEQNLPHASGILTVVRGNADRTILTFQKAWAGESVVWNSCVTMANENYKFGGWRQLATTDNVIMNAPISLGRTESTTEQAIYTVKSDIVLGRMYCFSTGASPSGSVQEIIFRTPQGDYTLKIADTNTVDTMSNAKWNDFNAGTRVFVYFTEKNDVKGAVITSSGYANFIKKSFNCTALTGYTIIEQDCYSKGGNYFIKLIMKKTDDTVFSSPAAINVFTCPYKPSTKLALAVQACSSNGGTTNILGGNGTLSTTGSGWINVPTNTKSILISGVI